MGKASSNTNGHHQTNHNGNGNNKGKGGGGSTNGQQQQQQQRPCRFNTTSIAIFVGVTLSSMHTLLSLMRSTRVIVDFDTRDASAHAMMTNSQVLHNNLDMHNLNTKVDFFRVDKEMIKRENHYSGMWWASREIVLKIKPEKQITFAGGSRGLFSVSKGVVMTTDWLDLCVEHISKFAKHFKDFRQPYTKDETTFRRIAEVIMKYFGRIHTQLKGVETAPTRDTIAILPMYELEFKGQHADKLLSLMSNPGEKERPTVLIMYSLAVTLASLWQIGIGRVVIVGRTQETPELMTAAFTIVEHLIETGKETVPMEMAYWGVPAVERNEAKFNHGAILMPKLATIHLQKALKGEMEESDTRALLGETPSRWKYVYFSEPDLILHTRPGALEQFREPLDEGKAISAWRFQVMAHEVDFPNYKDPRLLVPNLGPFADFRDLDPDVHACCDAGNYWPGTDEYEDCGKILRFYQCGFKKGPKYTEAEANEAHKRLSKYPMLRLKKTGLGTLLIQNHGRVCNPTKRGSCTAPPPPPPAPPKHPKLPPKQNR